MRLRGTESATPLQGSEFGAGDTVSVRPTDDEVAVVWQAPDGESTYVLTRLDSPDGSADIYPGLLYAGDSGSLTSIDTANDRLETLSVPGTVDALGPATPTLLGDGDSDVPYVDGADRVRVAGTDGPATTLATSGDGVHRAVGVDGSDELKLIGAGTAAGGEATTTLTGGVARKSPATVADIDGDGTPEVVFVSTDSEKLKYVGGANTVTLLTDADGDSIQRSDETGVV
ncbi:hypothetical protein BRC89_01080 [Halobacteriales archaeon QS_4_70_19]|nr:MAG: hypothetical protein BRC89_01080 [Halobacteriales archaeon QS_4_70_19]